MYSTLLNQEIIEQGYGHAYTRYPFAKMEEFRAAQRRAQSNGRGLWQGEDGYSEESEHLGVPY